MESSPLFNPNMPLNPVPQPVNPVKNLFYKLKEWIRNHKKLSAVLLAIIVLIIGFLIFYQITNRSQTPPNDLSGKNAFFDTNSSSISLTSVKKVYSMGEQIEISAVANSQDVPVTAFDVVIGYDSEYLTLSDRKPLLTDFVYFGNNDAQLIRVSAVLKPDLNAQTFNKTDLVNIGFTPKKIGKTILKIYYSPNSVSDSNLINSASQDVLGTASGIEIEIK